MHAIKLNIGVFLSLSKLYEIKRGTFVSIFYGVTAKFPIFHFKVSKYALF